MVNFDVLRIIMSDRCTRLYINYYQRSDRSTKVTDSTDHYVVVAVVVVVVVSGDCEGVVMVIGIVTAVVRWQQQ